MRGVLRMALADLRRRKVQALVVATVTLLSSLAGTMAVSLLVESDAPFDHAFERAAGAHLVVSYDTSRVTPEQLRATAALPGVVAAAGPWLETPGLEVTSGFGPRIGLRLLGRDDPGGPVDRVTVISGRWVQHPGEVVLAASIQRPLGVQVGDQLPVVPGQGVEGLRVVGVGAAVNDHSDGWLVPAQAAAIRPIAVPGKTGVAMGASVMFYRLASATTRADIDAASRRVSAALPPGAVLNVGNWLEQKRNADTTTAVMIPFLLAFSAFALVAAALVIGNVVTGAVIAGYRDIGIMKSIGFTPLQVLGCLSLQMIVPGALGAITGIAAGVAASQPFLVQTAEAFNLPPEPPLVPGILAGCLLAALSLVLLATLIPARHAARLSAVEAISTGSSPGGDGGRSAARVLALTPLPRAVSLGIGDAMARPVRSAMTLVAVAIGVATITFAGGLTRSLELVRQSLTHESTVQATLSRGGGPGRGSAAGGLSDEQAVTLLRGQPGTARFVSEGLRDVHVDGVGQTIRLFGYRGDAQWIGWDLLAGRWYSAPGEAVAPQALLDAARIHVGDSIAVSLDGRRESVRVVGVIFDTTGDNLLLRAPWAALTALAPAATPDRYDIQLAAGTNPGAYARQVLAAAGDPGLAVRVPAQEGVDQSFLLIYGVLAGLAGVLTLIAMAGVFNTVVLNTRERARDIAILRALGMTPRQVVTMVLVSVGLVGLAGAAVGIPAGQLLQHHVLTVMGQVAAATPVPARMYDVYGPGLLALTAMAGVAVGLAGGLLPATWAGRGAVGPALAAE